MKYIIFSKTIKSINLTGCKLDLTMIQYLVEKIVNPDKLVRLEDINLANNDLDEDSCEALAEIFKAQKYVKKLNISFNKNLGNEGLTTLLEACKENALVEQIIADDCGIKMNTPLLYE